jgi:hypothetical protein
LLCFCCADESQQLRTIVDAIGSFFMAIVNAIASIFRVLINGKSILFTLQSRSFDWELQDCNQIETKSLVVSMAVSSMLQMNWQTWQLY